MFDAGSQAFIPLDNPTFFVLHIAWSQSCGMSHFSCWQRNGFDGINFANQTLNPCLVSEES